MFLLCREKERLYHAKPFTRGTTAVIGSIEAGLTPTLITFMQFLSSVDDHVNLEVSLLCETLPALITCERFLSSVDDHVILKVSLVSETLPALITCERFLSSVDDHVSLETLFACQTRSTLSAGE